MGLIFPYRARLLELSWIYKDVICLRLQRPFNFRNEIGQAVALSIDKPGYELDVAPFTLTNFNDHYCLELIIKIRENRDGLTYGISQLNIGDMLQVSEPWDIYKFVGEGIFIAAGTGIIPFISIFRHLQKYSSDSDIIRRNFLLYACKDEESVFFEKELENLLGANFVKILSRQNSQSIHNNRIDRLFLKSHICSYEQPFYICGPSMFELDIKSALVDIGVIPELIQTGHRV